MYELISILMLIGLLYLYYKLVKYANKTILKINSKVDYTFVNYWITNPDVKWEVVSVDHRSKFFAEKQIWKLYEISQKRNLFFDTDKCKCWSVDINLISEEKDWKIYNCGSDIKMEISFTGIISVEMEEGKWVRFKPL
jgi:hypothetical protein